MRQIATFVWPDPARDALDALPVTRVSIDPAATGASRVVALIDRVLRDSSPLPATQTRIAAPLADPLSVPRHGAPDPGNGSAEGARRRTPTAHVEKALAEVRRWLGVGLKDACDAAGIDRGTVYAWRRRGSAPRPGTVGAVLRLHGLAASAVRAAGQERAREWFHAGDPSPIQRLIAAAGDRAVLTDVGRELRRALTGPPLPPPNPLLAATPDDAPARPLG